MTASHTPAAAADDDVDTASRGRSIVRWEVVMSRRRRSASVAVGLWSDCEHSVGDAYSTIIIVITQTE